MSYSRPISPVAGSGSSNARSCGSLKRAAAWRRCIERSRRAAGPSAGHEQITFSRSQRQRLRESPNSVPVRMSASTLEIVDTARAQPGALGKLLLGQTGRFSMTVQQARKGHRLRCQAYLSSLGTVASRWLSARVTPIRRRPCAKNSTLRSSVHSSTGQPGSRHDC